MSKLQEHVYAVQNMLNRGPLADDSRITNRLIAHFLKKARSLLLKRKIERGSWISEKNYHPKLCVPLVEAEYAECPGCNLPDTGCTLRKSTIVIPTSIVLKSRDTYRVKSITGHTLGRFTITNNQYAKYSLLPEQQEGWFIVGDYLYYVGNKDLSLVIVEAIWEDPEELDSLDPCEDPNTDSPCLVSHSDEFPIDADLVLAMYEITIEHVYKSLRIPKDDLNNSFAVEGQNDKEE